MSRWLKITVIVVVAIGAAAAAVFYTGAFRYVVIVLAKPHHGWDLAYKAPPPNYTDASAWAAFPGRPSPANFVPAGTSIGVEPHDVAVFFVHPTGYMNGHDWNSPLDPHSRTEENTEWMMANQASVFSSCCNVYAPRYREASIFTYLAAAPDIQKKAMALAYSDVLRAFKFFLDRDSQGRPFILASHSQGTAHAFRLIREEIDGTPLARRLVAAYLVGGGISNADVGRLKTIHPCISATSVHCLVHWATWGDGGSPYLADRFDNQLLCVNPISWLRDGPRTDRRLDRGGVPVSGRFQIALWGDDRATGVKFTPLKHPVGAWTYAACRQGILFVPDQSGGPFDGLDLGGKNYHGLDYPLFHMDIRDNAVARVSAYFAASEAAGR